MASKRGPEMQDPKPDEVLEFVRGYDCPFVETSDVSEQFDSLSQRAIYDRLRKLSERGDLCRREIGANSVVWYIDQSSSKDLLSSFSP
jgi:hypothetical protein